MVDLILKSTLCVVDFNSYLVSNLLGVNYKCCDGERFGCYKRFLLASMIYFNPFFICDLLAVIYE